MSTTTYTTAYGTVMSENRAGTTHDYVCDSGWSTRFLLAAGQTTTDTLNYWPFGEAVRNTGSTTTPLLFGGGQGYHQDASGRIYVRARLTNPALARWISMDPIGILALSPNEYIYCNNNPALYTDPLGWEAGQCIVGHLLPRQPPISLGPISLPPSSLLQPKFSPRNPILDPTLPPIGTLPPYNPPPFDGKQQPPEDGSHLFPWPGKGLLFPFPSDNPKLPGPAPGKSLKPNNDIGIGGTWLIPAGGGRSIGIGVNVNPRKNIVGGTIGVSYPF